MNKKGLIVGIIFLMSLVSVVFAEVKESELYYLNVKVLRIFPHPKGYCVVYRRPRLETGEVFIPYVWFKSNSNKAIYATTNDRIDPYMTLYTKNGEFQYVKLVAPKSLKNPVWGMLRNPSKYDSSFDGETLKFEY